MKFKNQKGKELKTTMSDDIMNQVANLTETELKRKGIFYLKDGTKFNVKQSDVKNLLDAQMNANMMLIEKGVVTFDMIVKDFEANF